MSAIGYSAEKMSEGLHVLITHRGRIRERLIAAWHAGLFAVGAGLPDDLEKRWRAIADQCSYVKDPEGKGDFAATINQMEEDDIVTVVELIAEVASEIDLIDSQ
jgi:hypothetical protein